jgi:phenylalanyl-tRNA synthetase beta chain
MKVSYNWLKNYISTNLDPKRMGEILTDTGLEVEGIEKIELVKGGLQGVFVGQVLTCEKHENADKLNVTTVDLGNGAPSQIVCGAPNVAAGQKVLVATVGCTLYPNPDEPFKIKAAKIRGVESEGMICAEDELGIGTSHAGIMVLPENAQVGQPAADFLALQDDYLIEIGLTPNRSDAMGHIGVARDLIAFLNFHEKKQLELTLPKVDAFKVDNTNHTIQVTVEDIEKAPRYAGVSINNIKVAPSPNWLQQSLRAIGLTPINNVVDVTNFVMHELGTPLHAFDAAVVNGNVVVRKAKQGEKIITLDDVERKLSEEDLIIANANEAMCIAGVFGGNKSGVTEKTTSVFLEAAYFNPISVRKTAKRHGLNTDASFRFERGVDPNMVIYAMKRAALLIKELAGGEISMEPVDLYPTVIEKAAIDFRFDKCRAVIGKSIDNASILTILRSLDFEIQHETSSACKLQAPTYRTDVTREIDVIEEVLRIYGFNNVELPAKLNMSLPSKNDYSSEKVQTLITAQLVNKGYFEMMNNSLTQSNYIDKLGQDVLANERSVHMLNPLSNDLDALRQSLIFQTLESVVRNQNRQQSDVKLFEFGKTYHKYDSGYQENKRLIIALSGRKEIEQWNTSNDKVTFYTLKGIVDSLFERLGLAHMLQAKPLKKSLLEDGIQLSLLKFNLGEIGWTNKAMRKHFGIKQPVFIADLDWDAVLNCVKMNKVKFTELPKTFAVRRDFSLLLDSSVPFEAIREIAVKSDKKLLKEVNLFDVYEGDKLPEGKKSYAVSFTFQDDEKTLKDEQIDLIMNKVRLGLETELKAELR